MPHAFTLPISIQLFYTGDKLPRMRTIGWLAAILVIPQVPLAAQGRNYGRSQVITQQGIAATSQTLASQAAVQILARGAPPSTPLSPPTPCSPWSSP